MQSKEHAVAQDLSNDPLLRLFKRVEYALEAESEALRNRQTTSIEEHIARKNLALLELRRAIANVSPEDLQLRASPQIEALRKAVQENLELVGRHRDAVSSISEILRKAIRESTSDGTYSLATAYVRSGA